MADLFLVFRKDCVHCRMITMQTITKVQKYDIFTEDSYSKSIGNTTLVFYKHRVYGTRIEHLIGVPIPFTTQSETKHNLQLNWPMWIARQSGGFLSTAVCNGYEVGTGVRLLFCN